MGESTLVDVDDARIQSLEEAVTEADELIEKGSESGARRLFLAVLAAIRLVTKAGRHLPQAPVSHGKMPVGATSRWPVALLRG